MSTTPPVPSSTPEPSKEKPLPNLGEEYGTGTKNLPPTKIVAIVLGVLAIALGVLAWMHRPQSPTTGTIDDIASVEVAGQNMVLVVINVSFHNNGESFYKMHTISAELDTGDGNPHRDDPAPLVDFDRYLQGFPDLKVHAMAPLKIDTIPAGGESKGSVLVAFPVTADAFAKRKSLKVIVTAYGEAALLIMTK